MTQLLAQAQQAPKKKEIPEVDLGIAVQAEVDQVVNLTHTARKFQETIDVLRGSLLEKGKDLQRALALKGEFTKSVRLMGTQDNKVTITQSDRFTLTKKFSLSALKAIPEVKGFFKKQKTVYISSSVTSSPAKLKAFLEAAKKAGILGDLVVSESITIADGLDEVVQKMPDSQKDKLLEMVQPISASLKI